ncbi:MAG: 3-hydroxyacyl-CoA dehydrogenase family protein, partial [Gloeobacteraceae cyanobacterium ES-bin-316]|nr:3-hydroxyacyl-CoA dehydrogenase family protein [Ferruginibacter sp.]
MSNRTIKKVAVLGSGVMGSRIACHFAGVGLQVLLLDIVAPSNSPGGGESSERNKIVNDALAAAIKSNPSPVYHQNVVKKITTGNFTDNMKDIASADWIIEVVVERLDIKQAVFADVEKFRKPGTLITSNTSGIPIHLMAEGRTEDFKKHFCGTHFFNPPRYLRLLEIIPTPHTDPSVVDFLVNYGDLFLGKTTVLAKDTPAFIANRIGVFGMMAIMNSMDKLGLSIDEIDALTGPVIGRPKSATFRTADVVGIDTLVKVAKGVSENCPQDEARAYFNIQGWLNGMTEKNWLGDKTSQGFFKKVKGADGKSDIQVLNLQSMEYEPRKKPKFATLETAKAIEDLPSRLKALVAGTDKAGDFYRQFHYALFSYISHRIPEISDEVYRVDDAMMAGFGWEIGAFESWDALGVAKTTEAMKAAGFTVAPWIDEMITAGVKTFYKVENGKRLYYDIATKNYKAIPGGNAFIVMRNFANETVWKNS